MRVLLINPVARVWAQPNVFPTGLGYVASRFTILGSHVEVIDLNVDRGGADWPVASPDLIGISGIITQYKEVKKIAKECRKMYPNTPIICGGPLASSVPNLLLDKTEVNICVVGEGELVISGIARLMKNKYAGSILSIWKQIIWETETFKDLSLIEWPAYDLFPIETYIKNPIGPFNKNKWINGRPIKEYAPLRTINMIGSRGCAYNCSFCFHCYMGQGFRLRGIKDIIHEMAMLINRYQVDYIQFTDDAFASNKKFMLEFCEEKIESGMPGVSSVEWSCAGRANVVDDEMCKAMHKSNCVGIWYGLESGNQHILNILNKKVTLKQYRKAIELNRKYFPYEDYTFIIGSPGETEQAVFDSVKFCKEMGITPSAVFYLTPYPGTPLFEYLKIVDSKFAFYTNNKNLEKFVLSLGEQGEKITWNCTGGSLMDEQLNTLHDYFIEETGAMNRDKHKG